MADMHQQVDFLSSLIVLLSKNGIRSVFGHRPFRPVLSKQLISSLRLLVLRERLSLLGFNPVYYLAWQTNTLILLTLFVLHLVYSVYREPFVAHFYLLWLKVVIVFSCVICIVSAFFFEITRLKGMAFPSWFQSRTLLGMAD